MFRVILFLDKCSLGSLAGLVFKRHKKQEKGDWLKIPNYGAEYRVQSAMGLRNHGKLFHKLRCELFLQTFGYEADAIEEILLLVPERASRSRACDAEDAK